jgi:predicted ribosome quality control (RQC) complex YloA/Tae2 family protein
MSLDGAFLHIVKTEILQAIPIGSRIDKIHQPSRDEVVLRFRPQTSGRQTADSANGRQIAAPTLLFSANAMSARVCLVGSTTAANLAALSGGGLDATSRCPPMFCTMLRKHLGGGRLSAITQSGLERVLNFDFVCTTEIGDTVNNRLIIEVMGRTSNLIIVNTESGRILDAIKRVPHSVSATRQVLPGLEYEPPPRDTSRHCLLDSGAFSPSDDSPLIKQLEGVSPVFVREAAYAGVSDFLQKAHVALTENKPEITLVSDLDGNPKDFCFMPITQYGDAMRTTRCESANALLDSFFQEKSGVERLKQRSGNIMKTLNTAYERLLRKIDNRRLELDECKGKEQFRIFGDLVNANVYQLAKGDRFLEAQDYESGEIVRIPLDERLSPPQNAQRYYAKYRKSATAEKVLTQFLAESQGELAYLESVIDAASRAVTDAEINAIRDEIGKKPANKSKQKSKPLPPLKFAASDGTEILVGRNNKQNDELTFKVARADDIWLHTKDIAGSHVILRCSGQSPSEATLTEAAVIAAQHSRGRESSRVPVDYCLAKFVKKPGGSKPGFVIFTHNRTLYVNPQG